MERLTTIRLWNTVSIIIIVVLIGLLGWVLYGFYVEYTLASIKPMSQTTGTTTPETTTVKSLVDETIYNEIANQLKTGGNIDVTNTSVLRSSVSEDDQYKAFVATETKTSYSYLVQIFTTQNPPHVVVSCAPDDQQLAGKTDCATTFKEVAGEDHE